MEGRLEITQEDIMLIGQSYEANYSSVRAQLESMAKFINFTLADIVAENAVVQVDSSTMAKCHVVRFDNVTILRPTVKEAEGFVHEITPTECRLRSMTYASVVFVDVTHEIWDTSVTPRVLRESQVYREVVLCKVPIMVEPDPVTEDCGGYFIIKGNEKVVLGQEKMKTNFPYVFSIKGSGKYELACEIRSWHETKMRSTSTMNIFLTSTRGGSLPEIFVQVPFIDTHISLRTIFYLLGVTSPEEMQWYILGNSEGQEGAMNHLVRHVLQYDLLPETTYKELLENLLPKTQTSLSGPKVKDKEREKKLNSIEHIITNEFLPHMGLDRSPETLKRKCFYLGLAVRKLLHVYLDPDSFPEDDRDHYANKRVDTTGVLMALLFRQLYRSFRQALSQTLLKAVDLGKFVNILDAITPKRITGGFKYALSTGNWGKQKANSSQTGVAQVLCRMGPVATCSHARRVNTPINREGKMAQPRQLHKSTYGILCPSETPEGVSCGLVKNLAFFTHIRTGYPSQYVIKALQECGDIRDILHVQGSEHVTDTQIFINGQLMGTVADPETLVANMRVLRRNMDIPFDVSITHSKLVKQIHINTDSGCLMRPLFVTDRVHLLPGILAKYRKYPTMIRNLWHELMLQGVVEYMDKEEEMTTLVASKVSTVEVGKHTHFDLQPSFIFGHAGILVPFPDKNQAPRNMYASAMLKQAVSKAAIDHKRRLDTLSHVLWYVQKPLVSTLGERLIDLDTPNPSGINIVLLIGCYMGFNQEDSCILNRGAVDRGLFRSSVYRTFKDEEKGSGTDAEKFEKPDPATTNGMRKANYDKVEADGLVAPGTIIEPGDIVISKTMVANNLKQDARGGKQTKRDHSTINKHEERCIVDEVLLGVSKEGKGIARVKTRAMRVPQIGDKFCVPDSDEVLTPSGWISLKNLQDGTPIAAYHPGSNQLKFDVPSAIHRYSVRENLLGYVSDTVDMLVTFQHKLYCRRKHMLMSPPFQLTSAETIRSSGHIHEVLASAPLQFPVSAEPAAHIDPHELAQSVLCGTPSVMFSQSDCPKILGILTGGVHSEIRVRSKAAADAVQLLAIRSGDWAKVHYENGQWTVSTYPSQQRPELDPDEWFESRYEGTVACPEIPTGMFLLRRNGKTHITGNSSRAGQKGVCGLVLSEEDMPFTASGIKPDLIVNPHAIPSRMTVAQLVEMVLGKLCAMAGHIGDATPFKDMDFKTIADELGKYGFEKFGEEPLYNGQTGELMEGTMFMGICYQMRLKHMVADKIHARARGPVQILTRQPVEGRSREGGLRVGEMERDTIISHGAANVLIDRLLKNSDAYKTVACAKCGLLAEPAKPGGYKLSGMAIRATKPYCRLCRSSEHVREIEIPYACKLLMQELQCLNFVPQLVLEDTVPHGK